MKQDDRAIDFEKSLGPWLGKTVKMVDYHLQEFFDRAGLELTKEQMIILKKLHEQDGLPQNELAALTFRDKSSLARLLAKMEAKSYISRVQSPFDKRINKVCLTDKGRAVFIETRPVISQIMDIMEDGITQEEKQVVIGILKKVQLNFEANTAL